MEPEPRLVRPQGGGHAKFLRASGRSAQFRRMLVGYVRSAPRDTATAMQEATLRGAGCEVVFVERVAASSGQPELERALASLRPDDVLVVTELDRLASGVRDLVGCVHQVQIKGASVCALEVLTDTCTAKSSRLLDALLSLGRPLGGDRSPSAHDHPASRPPLLDGQAVKLARRG